MKIETQTREDHQVKLTVEVEPTSLEEAKRRAARQIAQRTKIPGFRPGKAPYQVILRQVGEGHIVEEAIELLVQDIYPRAIDEAGIQPYGPGQLENIVSMDPPVLEFVIPLEAEVELGDYKSVQKEYEPTTVSDEDIERVLQDLRERQAVLEPAERSAQEGDLVYVKVSGQRAQPGEGEAAELVKERSMPLLVRAEEDQADEGEEWPFPGFSRHLIGLSAGDETTVEHTFPEDTTFESLRGVQAVFQVKVEDVKSRTVPALDDDFATTLGNYDNLEALRAAIRTDLEQHNKQEYEQSYDDDVMKQALGQATIKFPPQMLEREIDSMLRNLQNRLERQKLDMDLYLKTRQMDMDALRQELTPMAEEQLKRELYLFELARAENIEVSQAELQDETMRTVQALSEVLDEKEARQLGDQEVFRNLVGSVMSDLLARRSMQRLRRLAGGPEEEQPQPEAEDETQAETEVVAESDALTEAEVEDIAQAEADLAGQADVQVEEETVQVEPDASEAGASLPQEVQDPVSSGDEDTTDTEGNPEQAQEEPPASI